MIVASGPSAKDVPTDIAKGKVRCIAVNTSWEKVPWADILYACDKRWWDHYQGCPDFDGMRLTSTHAAHIAWGVEYIKCAKPDDRCLMDEKGVIGWGGNSGFHCLNMAMQFGCKKIILVGFDMTTKHGNHWHGNHPGPVMKDPEEKFTLRWRRVMDAAAKVADLHGVTVVNCSPISALKAYPKMSLEEALAL